MAKEMKTKTEPVEVVPVEPVKAAPVKAEQASVYTAAELAANHKVFGTSFEIVKVALQVAKKDKATFDEAKAIIDKFKTDRR